MVQERVRCLKIIKAQEAELADIQEKFGQIKSNLRASTVKNEELSNQLEELTYQLKKRVSEQDLEYWRRMMMWCYVGE